MNNNSNQSINSNLYLRTSNIFPEDSLANMAFEVTKVYIDVANAVNNRTISTFPTNRPADTGESWFIFQNKRMQTLRKVYTFGAIAAGTELDIPVNIENFSQFTRIWGTVVTNVIDWRPLPYVDPGTLSNGMALLVGPILGINNIRIILGATAAPVTSGLIILEWLSNP